MRAYNPATATRLHYVGARAHAYLYTRALLRPSTVTVSLSDELVILRNGGGALKGKNVQVRNRRTSTT